MRKEAGTSGICGDNPLFQSIALPLSYNVPVGVIIVSKMRK